LTRWLLALDTATDALSVAVGAETGVCFSRWQKRRRGHAEELAPLIEQALTASGIKAAELAGLITTIGPGTFTGVRIGLAAARGMRVALKIPVVGISTLDLMACQAGRRHPGLPVMAALDARRGQVYAQYFRRLDSAWPVPWSAPIALSAANAASMVVDGSILIGSGAHLIAEACDAKVTVVASGGQPDATMLLKMMAERPLPDPRSAPPAPLYLRAADAVPAKPLLKL